ncbi:MAG: hypothetical protein KDK39_10385 [Leptospiraceae bacterium]|nr:hypothetical protein [Leptospiraceae bacterium]
MVKFRNLMIILYLGLPSLLLADTVLLKNGLVLYGKVVGQSRTIVQLKTATGLRKIEKATVRRIIFGSNTENNPTEDYKKPATENETSNEDTGNTTEDFSIDGDTAADKTQETTFEQTGNEWRSAILPGWGQYRSGQKLKGSAIGGVFLLAGGALAQSHQQYLTARADLNNFGGDLLPILLPTSVANGDLLTVILWNQPFADLHASIDKQFDQVQHISWLLAGIYVYNLIDIFFLRADPQREAQSAQRLKSWQVETGISNRNSGPPADRNPLHLQPQGSPMESQAALEIKISLYF